MTLAFVSLQSKTGKIIILRIFNLKYYINVNEGETIMLKLLILKL